MPGSPVIDRGFTEAVTVENPLEGAVLAHRGDLPLERRDDRPVLRMLRRTTSLRPLYWNSPGRNS